MRLNASRRINIREAGADRSRAERKGYSRAAFEFPEGIRLRIPIQRLGAGRVTLRLMLGPRVICEGDIRRICRGMPRVS